MNTVIAMGRRCGKTTLAQQQFEQIQSAIVNAPDMNPETHDLVGYINQVVKERDYHKRKSENLLQQVQVWHSEFKTYQSMYRELKEILNNKKAEEK